MNGNNQSGFDTKEKVGVAQEQLARQIEERRWRVEAFKALWKATHKDMRGRLPDGELSIVGYAKFGGGLVTADTITTTELIERLRAAGKIAAAVSGERIEKERAKLGPVVVGKTPATVILDMAYASLTGVSADVANLPEKLLDVREALGVLIDAGDKVLATWEAGDLAGAVRVLDEAMTHAKKGV